MNVVRGSAIAAAMAFVLLIFATSGSLSTTITPEGTPPGSGACPTEPLIPGSVGTGGALVVLLQPGPVAGETCGLTSGGTLVGNAVVVGLYTPTAPANGTVPIAVEEFQTKQISYATPGPNNTTILQQETVQVDQVWSNTTISAGPGEAQEFVLNVPIVQSQEQLSIDMLDINETVSIEVPGAGIPIPTNYPELLLHDFSFEVSVVICFIAGIAAATAIRLKARHVERLWPFGVTGVFAVVGFAGWFAADYPLSVIPVGAAPEAVVAAPLLFAGMYFWLALFPTEAKIVRIQFPVADVTDGERTYDIRQWREFKSPDGIEYIGPGGTGALLRLFGIRTMVDNRILSDTPYRLRFAGFQSIKRDTYAMYFAWAEIPSGPKVLVVVRPKLFWFPWRSRSRESIEKYHRTALRDRVPAPDHVGFLFYVSPSRAYVAATGRQAAILVEGWIDGTIGNSETGLAFQRVLNAMMALRVQYKTLAIDWGQKYAVALQAAEEFPDSPVAKQMLEDLMVRMEAEILDQTKWYEWVHNLAEREKKKGKAEDAPTPPATPTARTMAEAAEPSPPWRRGRNSGPPPGAS